MRWIQSGTETHVHDNPSPLAPSLQSRTPPYSSPPSPTLPNNKQTKQTNTPFQKTGTGARFFYMATVSIGGGRRYEHIPFTVLASGFMGTYVAK
jgi:hypothetical protein